MKKLVPLHDLKDGQRVYTKISATGQVLEGFITDEICDYGYSFSKIPLKFRKYIPVRWSNGQKGAILFTQLKTKKP